MRLPEFLKAFILLVSLSVNGSHLSAQFSPQAVYNFDNMDLSEGTGSYASGTVINNDFYDCGVGPSSFALAMSGNPDTISLDPKVKELFENDFTLSFYFWADDTGLTAGSNIGYSLFSIQDDCKRDSSLNIRYVGIAGTGGTNDVAQLSIEYAANVADAVRFTYDLNRDFCWHQLVFTKTGGTYSLYVDGAFIESIQYIDNIALGKNFPVHVGYSDCVGRFDEPFNGLIDDIQIFNQAVSEEYIVASKRFPDQVISSDTTLFEGDSYNIFTGSSCAPSISWSPALGLDDAFAVNPVATPSSTVTYKVEFDHGNCISFDTVRISIIKEDNIDCENLLLPKAFTPNKDNLNDEFGISNKFIITDLQRFEIYDRWGLKLYQSLSKDELWDGTYKGQNMMPGTYVYKVEYTCLDNIYQKTGSFNLIK